MTREQIERVKEEGDYMETEYVDQYININKSDTFDDIGFQWLLEEMHIDHMHYENIMSSIDAFFNCCENYNNYSNNYHIYNELHYSIYDKYAIGRFEYSVNIKPKKWENRLHFTIPLLNENANTIGTIYLIIH